MKHVNITLFIFMLCLNLQAQILNSSRNSYRAGDEIFKQQVEFKDPGASGKEITWDFSHQNIVNDKYQLVYFSPNPADSNRVTGVEHQTYYHYELKSDTLWMTGYENRTTRMNYQHPEALLRFPFRYGDTIHTTFSGNGSYCQKVDLIANGFSDAIVDACGKLITPENDTLKQVLRVHRTKEFTNIGIDSTQMRMETYQWFVRGNRYPVFETIKSYTVQKDSTLQDFSTSFYFSTINREQLHEDIANNHIIDETNNQDDIIINCSTYPNPVATDLTLNYELSVDARVSFLLCDISGRPWVNVPYQALAAGIQQQKIPMSGLFTGNYILYIKVNDKVYRRTILKI